LAEAASLAQATHMNFFIHVSTTLANRLCEINGNPILDEVKHFSESLFGCISND
jgi:hypothetical protein